MLKNTTFLYSILIILLSGCSKKMEFRPPPPTPVPLNPLVTFNIDNKPVLINSTWQNIEAGNINVVLEELDTHDSVISKTTDTLKYVNLNGYKKRLDIGRYSIKIAVKDGSAVADSFIRFNAHATFDVFDTTDSITLSAKFTDGLITIKKDLVKDDTTPSFKPDGSGRAYPMYLKDDFYYIYVHEGIKGVVTFQSKSANQTATKTVIVEALNHYNINVLTNNNSLQIVFTKFAYNPVVVRPITEKFVVVKSGNDCYIRTNFSASKDIVQKVRVTQDADNKTFAFAKVFLIDKQAPNIVANFEGGAMLINQNDDTAPINAYGTGHIMEGHGVHCPTVFGAHDKKPEDLLSLWTDGVHLFYLIKIIDDNTLLFYCKPYPGILGQQITQYLSGSKLRHVSGAVNTSPIDTRKRSSDIQQYPVVSGNVNKIYADGREIFADGTYTVKEIRFSCEYDVIDPNTLGLLIPFSFNNGKSFMRVSANYVYQPNGVCIPHISVKFKGPKFINSYYGLQAAKLRLAPGYPRLFGYMPKVKSVNGVDYKRIVETTVTPPPIKFDASTISDLNFPPDRYIQLMANMDGTKKIGFAMGFNTAFGVGKNSVRKDLGEYWQMASTGKAYPRVLFEYAANDQSIDFVGYRAWFDATAIGKATALYSYREAGADYVYIDYHKNVNREILSIDPLLNGGRIEVVEQIGGITLHTHDFVPDTGLIISVSGGYGMLLLKITR